MPGAGSVTRCPRSPGRRARSGSRPSRTPASPSASPDLTRPSSSKLLDEIGLSPVVSRRPTSSGAQIESEPAFTVRSPSSGRSGSQTTAEPALTVPSSVRRRGHVAQIDSERTRVHGGIDSMRGGRPAASWCRRPALSSTSRSIVGSVGSVMSQRSRVPGKPKTPAASAASTRTPLVSRPDRRRLAVARRAFHRPRPALGRVDGQVAAVEADADLRIVGQVAGLACERRARVASAAADLQPAPGSDEAAGHDAEADRGDEAAEPRSGPAGEDHRQPGGDEEERARAASFARRPRSGSSPVGRRG